MPNVLQEIQQVMDLSQSLSMVRLTYVKVNQLSGMLLKNTKNKVTTLFQKIMYKDSR